MSGNFELTAELRSQQGKGASRRLRRLDNRVPAIMYGAEKPPVSISFNHHHVTKALENEGFYSHILTIHLNGEKQQAVLKDLQRHPFKPKILHMDLLRINPKEKITMHVPLHFIGGDVAPGVKDSGGIVAHVMNNLEVRCLPADLPEFISVDVSKLELDQAIHLNEIKLPKGIEVVTHGHAHASESVVVKIHIPRAALEEEATPAVETAPGEVPTVKDEKGETADSTKEEKK